MSRIKLLAVADIWATALALSALIFMALTFYAEGFLGKGMLFYEPSIPMALFEFCATLYGLIMTTVLLIWRFKHSVYERHDNGSIGDSR